MQCLPDDDMPQNLHLIKMMIDDDHVPDAPPNEDDDVT
jgi:hypothetical protein